MKLGIVGSSYSVGRHESDGQTAAPFEQHFSDIDPDLEIVNAACASKGTELYLDKVVYLKREHNIDTLLMEIVNNRRMLNIQIDNEYTQQIKSNPDIKGMVNHLMSDSASMYNYQRYLYQPIPTENVNADEHSTWSEIQRHYASFNDMNEFWAMTDCYQTISLCNMLSIRVIAWNNRWHMPKLPGFENMLQGSKYVDFNGYPSASDYYFAKYSKEEVLFDAAHFNDKVNKEMVTEYLHPALL